MTPRPVTLSTGRVVPSTEITSVRVVKATLEVGIKGDAEPIVIECAGLVEAMDARSAIVRQMNGGGP